MASLKVLNISDLGQSDINETKDVIYLIDKEINLNIKASVNAKILDITKDSNVVINVDKGAYLEYYILESTNTNRTFNVLGEVNLVQVTLDKSEERLDVNLLVENAKFESKCLSFASKINTLLHSNIYHKDKNTYSNISNIGVALDGGYLLFDVVSKIEKGMSKSEAKQLSRGIVVDDNSKVDAKPVLLIDEYDCFANHGASIGKVSDEDLFYLMSRGLTKNESFLLILEGIVKPFIDIIPLEDYKNRISDRVNKLI